MPGSRSGTASRSRSAPIPARAADSLTAQVIPCAAQVLEALEQAFRDQFQRGLDQELLRERVPDLHAGTRCTRTLLQRRGGQDAPPMPSRPVVAPYSTMNEPACAVSEVDVTRSSALASPTHITLTLGLAL